MDADENGQPEPVIRAMMMMFMDVIFKTQSAEFGIFPLFLVRGKQDNDRLQTDLHGLQSWGHGAVMWFYSSIL